jgi:N-acetylmuramoyl-L-alanine amidase
VAVLRGLNCPGVLVESLFLSNEAEARRAATPAYRQQIADAMFAGVRSYAATLDSVRPKSSAPAATASRPVSSNSP